jgi:hypothetical protein
MPEQSREQALLTNVHDVCPIPLGCDVDFFKEKSVMSDPEFKFRATVDLHAKGGSKYLIAIMALLLLALSFFAYLLYPLLH